MGLSNLPLGVRKPLRDSEVGKAITVEAGKPLRRAKPQESARVPNDPVHAIIGKTVQDRVTADGKLHGEDGTGDGAGEHPRAKDDPDLASATRRTIRSTAPTSWVRSPEAPEPKDSSQAVPRLHGVAGFRLH